MRKQQFNARLHPRLIEFLRSQESSQATIIEQAVVKAHDLCPKCFRRMFQFHDCQLNPHEEIKDEKISE